MLYGALWDLLKKADGGGGGNRTRVRKLSTRNVYGRRPSLDLAAWVAPGHGFRLPAFKGFSCVPAKGGPSRTSLMGFVRKQDLSGVGDAFAAD